jgi:hypothetical protein
VLAEGLRILQVTAQQGDQPDQQDGDDEEHVREGHYGSLLADPGGEHR